MVEGIFLCDVLKNGGGVKGLWYRYLEGRGWRRVVL
jgi:hypothetical protein